MRTFLIQTILINPTFLKRYVEIVDTKKSPVLIKDKSMFVKDNNKISRTESRRYYNNPVKH